MKQKDSISECGRGTKKFEKKIIISRTGERITLLIYTASDEISNGLQVPKVTRIRQIYERNVEKEYHRLFHSTEKVTTILYIPIVPFVRWWVGWGVGV